MEKPDFNDQSPYPPKIWNARMVSVSRNDEDPAMNRMQILARTLSSISRSQPYERSLI